MLHTLQQFKNYAKLAKEHSRKVYLLMPRCCEEEHAVDAADEVGAEDSESAVAAVGECQPTRRGLRSRDSRPQGQPVAPEPAQFDDEERPRVHLPCCKQSSVT